MENYAANIKITLSANYHNIYQLGHKGEESKHFLGF
jgi:hypothetical protein